MEPHLNDAQNPNGQPGMHNLEGTSTLFQSSKILAGSTRRWSWEDMGRSFIGSGTGVDISELDTVAKHLVSLEIF